MSQLTLVSRARCKGRVTHAEVSTGHRDGGRISFWTDTTKGFVCFVPKSVFLEVWSNHVAHWNDRYRTPNMTDAQRMCKWLLNREVRIEWSLFERETHDGTYAQYLGFMKGIV